MQEDKRWTVITAKDYRWEMHIPDTETAARAFYTQLVAEYGTDEYIYLVEIHAAHRPPIPSVNEALERLERKIREG